MKMVIYYCTVILGWVVALFILIDHLNVTAMSVVPIILIALSSFQASLFKNEQGNTYGSNYNEEEKTGLTRYMSVALKLSIPWHIPFVCFFDSGFKLISVIVYLLGMFGGTLVYVLKNGRKVQTRLNKEAEEAKKQSENEELGRIK